MAFGGKVAISPAELGEAIWRGEVGIADMAGTVGMMTTRSWTLPRSRSFDAALSARSSGGRTMSHAALARSQSTGHRLTRKRFKHPVISGSRTATEVVDEQTEQIFVKLVEQPVWLDSCMEYPSVQRYCFPAEYATRHQRENQDTTVDQDTAHASFNLPDFRTGGFTMINSEEVGWRDHAVPHKLGLQLAVHRKTAQKRFCYIQSKGSLPHGVGPEQIKVLVRNLKRCDHVNVLHLIEAYEDYQSLYFMYEHYPCVTVQFMLENATSMTQEQIVNTARECCAATAFASGLGLCHLGWTLWHVLLPEAALDGDQHLAKVFGFGLMGMLHCTSIDRLCWAPEALDKASQVESGEGGNFVSKMELGHKMVCDSWSIGCIVYALVGKQVPFMNEQEVLRKRWSFTLVFDEIDKESKTFIESLLHPLHEKRMKPERALHCEWVRRRWRPPLGSADLYCKVEEFCHAPLAKRLFGRFLCKFLEATHFRRIAGRFYALDSQGKGTISLKDLQYQAKMAGRPMHGAQAIFDWLKVEGAQHISLMSFASAFAEEVADGPSLRIAFESLDEDGSEQVSPEELWEVLVQLDSAISVDDVKKHIQSVESAVEETDATARSRTSSKQPPEEKKDERGEQGDGEGGDGTIDYQEFLQLFPVRMKRLKELKDRVEEAGESSMGYSEKFRSIQGEIGFWLRTLETEIKNIERLTSATVGKSEESEAAAQKMKGHFVKIAELLGKVPRPEAHWLQEMEQQDKVKRNSKHPTRKKAHDEWGYDTFLHDQAHRERWASLLVHEMKALKAALKKGNRLSAQVDSVKAHDAANALTDKVAMVVAWTKSQVEEYEAAVESYDHPEALMPSMPFSSRSLRHHGGEDHDGDNDDGMGMDDDGEGHYGGAGIVGRFIHDVTSRLPWSRRDSPAS